MHTRHKALRLARTTQTIAWSLMTDTKRLVIRESVLDVLTMLENEPVEGDMFIHLTARKNLEQNLPSPPLHRKSYQIPHHRRWSPITSESTT